MIAQRVSPSRLVRLLGSWRGGGYGYRELSAAIEMLVRDGVLAPGSALPAERALAEALGVSRTTVSAGYQLLREAGVALTRQGSATVIRSPRPVAAPYSAAAGGGVSEIDLTVASPGPWAGLRGLAADALAGSPDHLGGDGYDTIGELELRRAIADRYVSRGLPTSPEQIMVTLGAQHAIFLVARTVLGRGDRSAIEAPSYPHAREALAAMGALVAELPDPGSFGEEDRAGRAATRLEVLGRVSPKLAYLIPDHRNPSGTSIPEAERGELLRLLAERGSLVIADETTAELTLGGARTVRPFAAFADREQDADAVITIGSLGKTLWGGLRVGWIRATSDLIDRFERERRIGDLGTGSLDQAVAHAAVVRSDEILADRSRELTSRHRVLTEQLAARFPTWRVSSAEGGVSVWVDLGEHRSTALCRESAAAGVRLAPGPRFGSPGVFERFLRIPFTADEEQLIEAVDRMVGGWERRGEAARGLAAPGSLV